MMSCLVNVYSKDTNSHRDTIESIPNQAYPCARHSHNCMHLICQKMGKYLGSIKNGSMDRLRYIIVVEYYPSLKKGQGFGSQHKWLNLVNVYQMKPSTEYFLHLNELLRVEEPIATEGLQP